MWWKHSKDQNRKRVLWNGIRVLLIDNFKGATTCKYDIWPGFKSPILEYMGEILYNKGCQMIELFILFWYQIRNLWGPKGRRDVYVYFKQIR